ncbi:MAG TPA: hypothetical protein VEB21_13905, partial [Terriglobales bacterium]|nr:hypothetical protein [Terriglobales bacterium]
MALPGDYSLVASGDPPPGYPSEPRLDIFSERCGGGSYAERRAALLAHLAATPAAPFMKAPYHELARIEAGGVPHAGIFAAALDFVAARRDCSDFVAHAILRWLEQYPDQPDLGVHRDRAEETLLGFKYWPDEPGRDSLCTWTENHQILFSSAAYLVGQRYPNRVFSNSGLSGREQMARHRPRIERWLALRFRTGFSEWLSHVYYDEDIAALTSLIQFSADAELARRAAMVLDLLLLDIALNHFRGRFGCTHGRSYDHSKRDARAESTADVQKLLFGAGAYGGADCMGAICLALTPRYRLPKAIETIGSDCDRPRLINRQRMGLRLADAERWGLGFDNAEDGMVWLSLEAYTHPRTIALVLRMFDRFGWWHN